MKRAETLRLLVYQRAYWPLFGGYAHHLRYRLRLLPRFGIEPWVLTQRIGDLKEEEIVDDVLVRRVRVPRPWTHRQIFAETALFPQFFRYRAHYDLALLSSANVSGGFIRDVCRRPVIRESIIGEDHAAKFRSTLAGRARELVFRRVDFVVAISPALEQAYREVNWPAGRLCLIPRGVNNDVFRPAASGDELDRLRAELDLPKRPCRLFLTVGAVKERKGHLDLAEAWRLLSPDLPAEHLIIVGPVGDESYYQGLTRRITELGLTNRIHFKGRSDRVPDLMRCVDGFVFASVNEGLPNSIIEAMSSGLPVVAFDIEGILSFIVNSGKDGIIVPCGDREGLAREVARLSGSSELRAELGRAARGTAIARFSLEKEAEAHAQLYWTIHEFHRRQSRS